MIYIRIINLVFHYFFKEMRDKRDKEEDDKRRFERDERDKKRRDRSVFIGLFFFSGANFIFIIAQR